MICQCGCLSVSLVADVTRVRLVVRVNHVMLVQTGILCETLIATNHLADIWPLACGKYIAKLLLFFLSYRYSTQGSSPRRWN